MSQPGAPEDRPQPVQYPPWQPEPPRRVSAVAVILVSGSAVVVVLMTLAFLAYGYPGFLRPVDAPPDTAHATPLPDWKTVLPGGVEPPITATPTPDLTRPAALPDPVNCEYLPDKVATAPKAATPPPEGPTTSKGQVRATFDTTAGVLDLTLDRALAPCTVANFLALAKQGFYVGTACHRLSTAPGLQMLQCGDPVGDGTGGPGYTIPDETFPELTYRRGTLAMAKSSLPHSGGSQFFMVYGTADLGPDFTVFGTVGPAGLETLDRVAAGGIDQSTLGTDGTGRPTVPVRFTRVDVP